VTDGRLSGRARAHLDLIRGAAALLVFVDHARQVFLRREALAPIVVRVTSLGHEAVLVFFVLSGFLVTESTLERPSLRRYAAARASRLLTVYWPALVLGGALDLAGTAWFGAAGIYGAGHHPMFPDWAPADYVTPAIAVGNVFFLQSIRALNLGSNLPLWTLAWEAWFYVAFPLVWIALTAPIARRLVVVAALVGLGVFLGPNVVAGFAVWLLGAALAAARKGDRTRGATLFALAIALNVYGFFAVHPLARPIVVLDFCKGLIALGIIALSAARPGAPSRAYAALAGALASVSYSLYLVHVPMLVFLAAALSVPPRFGVGSMVVAMAVTFGYAVAVWFVFERRTARVRRWLTRA